MLTEFIPLAAVAVIAAVRLAVLCRAALQEQYPV